MFKSRIALTCSLAFLFAETIGANFRTMFPETSGRVSHAQIQNMRVAYWEGGRGPALILIHGQFGDHRDWQPVLERLAKRHRVIAVDLPGYGDSDKPDRAYDMAFYANVLQDLSNTLKVERANVVGNSFGGQVAISFALTSPSRVGKLILADSGGFLKVSDAQRQFFAQRFSEEFLLGLTPETNRALFLPVVTNDSEAKRQYLDKQNEMLSRADYPAYARALSRNIRLALDTYLLDDLPRVQCPTLLLWGERDVVLPVSQAQQALPKLPKGELRTLPGCGHAPQLDCPDAFVSAVEEFLNK